MLKNLYGKVILQKDSILYHTESRNDLSERGSGIIRSDGGEYDSNSEEIFNNKPGIFRKFHTPPEIMRKFPISGEKPMLFCTFHPSEYCGINDYITYIKLKKILPYYL